MIQIAHADPLSPEGRALVAESQAALEAVYPPEEIFSLPAEELARPGTLYLLARQDGRPAGCAALVACRGYGEVKRLYVRPAARGAGVGQALMAAVEAAAMAAGLPEVRLETGDRLVAAVALYRRLGYRQRGPFGAYAEHPASLFMGRSLAPLPRRLDAQDAARPAVLALLGAGLGEDAGGRDPALPAVATDPGAPAAAAAAGELWAVFEGPAPVAAMLLAPRPGALRFGRLAVAEAARRRGLARRLVAVAAARARALGLPEVELRAGAGPDASDAAVAALGFRRPGATAPPGPGGPAAPGLRKPV